MILTIIVTAIATNQVVEIWHHSSLFAFARLMLQNYNADLTLLPRWVPKYPAGFITSLLLCPWCFSVWIAGAFFYLSDLSSQPDLSAGQSVMTILCISRLSNLLADLQKRLRKARPIPALPPVAEAASVSVASGPFETSILHSGN